jgi:aspartate kinase
LAKPLTEKIKYRVESIIKKPFEGGELFVTQGFIGRDELGNVTTLGREGSDYSAALFAQALEALEVQIWTDVNGIFECDPNIVAHARKIPYMSYDQATRMAKSGAKVLFGKTLSPLREQQIPVFVRNSQEPLDEGSLISFKPFQGKDLLSVCIKKRSDCLIVTLIGENVDMIEIEQSEIDRGEEFRSFFIPGNDECETLNLWYTRYFS